LLPGRTEYVEKYGRVAGEFLARGYATLVIDWRGQGLADRLLDDPLKGHVIRYTDYQMDLRAMIAAAKSLGLPEPYHMLGHSMAGPTALLAAMEGVEVASVSFSGPMWGIRLTPALRPVAWALTSSASMAGMGALYAPGAGPKNYVMHAEFDDNLLTRDEESFRHMQRQYREHPDLMIAGPTMHWVLEALAECFRLYKLPSPDLPCLTLLGDNERIVDVKRVHDRMARWPKGTLEVVKNGEHETLMEGPDTRRRLVGLLADHYDRAAGKGRAV